MSAPNNYGSNNTKAQAVIEVSRFSGGIRVTGTGSYASNFNKISALAATVIATLTNQDGKPPLEGTLTAIPLPANGEITGYFNQITLTSGDVILYF